jgi:integrase
MTARAVAALTKPGRHRIDDNLYLQVRGRDQRIWLFRYVLNGRAHSLGLGRLQDVSLAEARRRADAARSVLRAGQDPQEARMAVKAARAVTFTDAVTLYWETMSAAWSASHHADLRAAMGRHILPRIGDLPVAEIDVDQLLRVLNPIWSRIPQTAGRLRSRIEAVLDFARVRGWRTGENPARWRGFLEHTLPPPGKLRPRANFIALPWQYMPTFMAALRQRDGAAPRALEFVILTAARWNEVRGATWSEINRDLTVWTVPAARMKTGRERRVPLSAAALAVLQAVEPLRRDGGLLFPGADPTKPLGAVALRRILHRMGCAGTVHGARSSFCSWAASATDHPREIAEAALAHLVGSEVERAYQRSDVLERRRRLMDDWAAFLARPAAEIVPLRALKL